MRKIESKKKLCLICMEEHEVDVVEVIDTEIFKNEEVSFSAVYEYCANADEYLETEEMIKLNSLAMKDAYRKKVGLLTSGEITSIRKKYAISQKDFSEILDWGKATVTRYENHQVQDRVHDDVLRKIDSDPKWFIEMLERGKARISAKAYSKYFHNANEQFRKKQNQYLINAIYANYAGIEDDMARGCTQLNLAKVIEMINYLAKKVNSLHKVKLMKMLWYSDILSYKRNRESISGLVYKALPNGAVPLGYDQLVLLEGVEFDTVYYGENIGYKFKPAPKFEIKDLSKQELTIMDDIISNFGKIKTKEIVDRMHEEEAYKCTQSHCIISYAFADSLTID